MENITDGDARGSLDKSRKLHPDKPRGKMKDFEVNPGFETRRVGEVHAQQARRAALDASVLE